MTNTRNIFIPLGMMIISVLGCSLFSSKTSGEIVLAATEVGTPTGDKGTKDIGPAGGSLSSPDGRLTLTVPPNALTEKITFGIQPINNKIDGGLGSAYRLEPSGRTFVTPLEISFRYDDHDIEGTVGDALAIAYQDEQKAWHVLNVSKLDQSAKTLTVLTTHFTDWSFLAKVHISPETATIRVGRKLDMEISGCLPKDQLPWLTRVLDQTRTVCHLTDQQYIYPMRADWYADAGTIDDHSSVKIVYTAPEKKPNPNVVTVSVPYWLEGTEGKRGMLTAHIKILDHVYFVNGNAGGSTAMSGVICDLEKPFTLVTNNPFIAPFELTPSSANGGTWRFTGKGGLVGGGEGTYTIEGTAAEKTGMLMSGFSHGHILSSGERSGGGDVHLTLTPLTGDECGGG